MDEHQKQAKYFLEKAKATCKIVFEGCAINSNWRENEKRNFYNVVLTTPKGSMSLTFWDSIYNTRISQMNVEEYARRRFKCEFRDLTIPEKTKAFEELKAKKAEAQPTAYDVLACMTKHNPGLFEEFCFDFGYDEDSKTAERVYIACIREYEQLRRIFTDKQMKELQEIY